MKKDKTKLALKFILISIPLIIICIIAYIIPMSYMSQEYVLWKEEKDYVNNSDSGKVRNIIVGDSRAKASIIPEMLDAEGKLYNIGIGGATSIEMYYAVNNFINVHGAPETAVVIFAPYHFCDIDNWDQTLFTNYLTVPETISVYADALRFGEGAIAKKGALTDMISFRLRLPTKYLAQMYEAHFTGYEDINTQKYEQIRKDRGYCEFGSDDENDGESYEVHHEDFDSSDMVLYYYERLIGELSSNNTRIYILQAPVNEVSSKAIHPEFVKGYQEFLEDIKEKYPDIYLMKDIPEYDNGYFGDNNHLNRRGAEKYTHWLKEESGIDIFR